MQCEWNEDSLLGFCHAALETRVRAGLPSLEVTAAAADEESVLHVTCRVCDANAAAAVMLKARTSNNVQEVEACVDAHDACSQWCIVRARAANGQFNLLPRPEDEACAAKHTLACILDALRLVPDDDRSDIEKLVRHAVERLVFMICAQHHIPYVPDPLVIALLQMPCARCALTLLAPHIHPLCAHRAACAQQWTACAAIVYAGARVDRNDEVLRMAVAQRHVSAVEALLSRTALPADAVERSGVREWMQQMTDQDDLDTLFRTIYAHCASKQVGLSFATSESHVDAALAEHPHLTHDESVRASVGHFSDAMASKTFHIFPELAHRLVRSGAPIRITLAHVLCHAVFQCASAAECLDVLCHCDKDVLKQALRSEKRSENAFVAVCHATHICDRHRVVQALLQAAEPLEEESLGFFIDRGRSSLFMEAVLSGDAAILGALLTWCPAAAHPVFETWRIVHLMRSDEGVHRAMGQMLARTIWVEERLT